MGVAGSKQPGHSSRAAVARSTSSRSAPINGVKNGHARPLKSQLDFVIPSDVAATRDVKKQIMERVEALHYVPQSIFAINLALEEGLANAVKHGNRHDPDKRVHIQARVTPRSTEIIIEDQGHGFARARVPDPCAEENLLKCSGRGILLMEAYMDKVQYSQGGRRVRMVKKNI